MTTADATCVQAALSSPVCARKGGSALHVLQITAAQTMDYNEPLAADGGRLACNGAAQVGPPSAPRLLLGGVKGLDKIIEVRSVW